MKGLFKGASDGHHLAHRLHRSGENGIGSRKFLESEARNLSDHVVDGRLEARRSFLGDIVRQFVEGVTDGELCRDLGNRVAGRLGS